MRVISGKYKHRIIKHVDSETTRPTQDKVKESIFNIIGPYFDGGLVLDLFAGSGAIGIEAISRGMDRCIFVDTSKEAIKTIKENLNTLKITNSLILNKDYLKALNDFDEPFDFIFLDPPYRMHVLEQIIEIIAKRKMLAPNGIIVCEYEKQYSFDSPYFTRVKEVNYGIRNICIYRGDEEWKLECIQDRLIP